MKIQQDVERALGAMNTPTRLTIVSALAERPRTHRELLLLLGTVSNAGFHLRKLQSAGLVLKDDSHPHEVVYSLHPDVLGRVIETLNGLRKGAEQWTNL